MTSDRGNTGAAEMQLPSTPVTPKTTNLNPNATVFHSIKGPATPPDSATEGGWSPEFEAPTPTTTTPVESITYVNGEADQQPLPTNITFPPTPESPPQPPPPMVVEYTNTNNSISSDVSVSGGVGGSSGVVVAEIMGTGDNKPPGVAAPPVEPGSTLEAQVLFPSSEDGSISPNVSADENILEGALPDNQLRAMLKHQLEYYFSRENLAQDSYLVSQMDADQFVPISTIAKFNQVKKLTANLDLVVDVLRESINVQVDDKGEKVRPVHQRCVVILREVPETTPVQDVEQLFMGANCPKFVSCEFASGNCWYITFDSEEDAQRAYQYLREEVQLFLGKPIMARIKAKPILRTYGPKTNVYKVPGGAASAATSPTAPVSPPTTAPIATPQQQIISPQQQQPPDVFSPPQQQQQQPAKMAAYPPPPPQQVAAVVSSMQNVNVPFISSPQQQSVPVSLPFFPPSNNSVPIWSQQPAVTFFTDPSTAFAANGYTPTGTFKLPNASNKHQPQPHTHAYQNVRNSQQQYRNQKPSRYGQQTATQQQQLPPQLTQQLPQPQQVHHMVAAAAQAAAAVNSNNTNINTTPTAQQQQQLTAPAATATLHQQQQAQQQPPALTHHTQSLQQPTMTAVQVNSATNTTPVTPLATSAQMAAVAPPTAIHTQVSAMLASSNENAAAAANNNLLEGGATTIVSAVSSNTGAGGHSSAPPSTMMMSSGSSSTNNTNSSTQRSTVSVQHAQQGAIVVGGNMNGERHNLSIPPPPPPAPVAVNGGGGSTGTGHSSRASPRGMNSNNMGIGGYESVPHATFSGQHSVYGGSGVVGGVATPGGMRPHRGEASYHHNHQHHQHGGGAGGGGPNGNHAGPPPPQHQHGHHHPAAPTSGHHHHGNSQQYHHSHSYHNNHQSNTSNHSHHPSQSHSNNYHSSESGAPTAGPGPSHPHSRYQPHGGGGGGGGGGTASGSHGNSAMNHNHAEASVKEIPPRHQRNRDRDLDRRQEERRPDRREEGRPDDRRDYYRNRRRGRMEEGDGAKRNPVTAKDRIPESFELEANSFPPLPGSQNNTSSNGVFESKMSDVVKGCAKSIGTSTKETSTGGAGSGVSSSRPPQSKTTDHLKETVSVSATATPAEAAGKQRRSSTPPATGSSGISGGGHGGSSSTSTGGSLSTGQTSSITMAAVAAAGPTVSCPPPPKVMAADHLAVCVNTATPAPSATNTSSALPTPPMSPQKVNKATTAKPANCPQKSAAETSTAAAPPVKSGPEPSAPQSKVETQQPKARSHSTTKVEKESTPDRSTGPAPSPGLVPSKMSYASVVSKPNQPPLTNGEAAVFSSDKGGDQQNVNSGSKLDQQQQSSNAADQSAVSVPQEAGKKSPIREVNNYRRGDRDNDRRGGSDRDDRDTTTGGYNNRGGPAMRGDRYDGPKDQRPSFGGRRGGNYRRDRGDRDSYNSGSNRGDKEYYGSNHRGGDKDYYGNRGGDKDYYSGNHRGGDKEYYGNNRGGDKEYYGNNHRGGDNSNKEYYGGNRSGDKEYYGGGNRGGDRDSYNNSRGGGGGYRGGRMMDRDNFQRDRRKDERIAVKE